MLLENLGSTSWNGWTLLWTFGGNQQITNLWNGVVSQSGQTVQVTNATWNGTVAAGSNTRIGFQASYSGANAIPNAFQINGIPCNDAGPLPTVTHTVLPSATHTPLPTATNTVQATATSTPTVTPINTVPPVPTNTPTVSPTPITGAACQVLYQVSNQWQDGFTADVTVLNLSSTAWNGWTVAWTFSGNQQITNLWNGIVSQNGQSVQVVNAGWNGTVTAGGSSNFGFQAAYSGANAAPTSFRVNGIPCTPTQAQLAPTPAPVLACSAVYAINNDWGSGFVTTVTLTNQGNVAWHGWTANWDFVGNQQITNLWNGAPTQTGTQVAIANVSWNSMVAPNTSASFGFVGSYSAANPKPTNIVVNGQSCTLSAASAAIAQTQDYVVTLLEPGQDATLRLTRQAETTFTIPGAAIDAAGIALLLPESSAPALPVRAYAVDGIMRLLLVRKADAQLMTLAQPYTLTIHRPMAFTERSQLQQWETDHARWTPIRTTLTTDTLTVQSEQTDSALFALTEVGEATFLPTITR